MVDRSLESSLESVAADRGITICFADLDGADGLWLPEERTILLARGLSSKQAADVLEHELSHVDIEDGHAALDAATHRRMDKNRWAVAGTAAASLVLLIGLNVRPNAKPTADSHPAPPAAGVPRRTAPAGQPVPTTAPPTKIIMIDGGVRTQTVTVTPSVSASRVLSPTGTRTPGAGASPTKAGAPPVTATGTPAGGPSGTTPPPTTPPVDTATPTPSGTGAGVGTGGPAG